MADVLYLSRSAGPHDTRWVETLHAGGHRVAPLVLGDEADAVERLRAEVSGTVDLVVAGPVTDAGRVAVEADVAPVLLIAWGFDLMLELDGHPRREEVVTALRGAAGVHVDSGHLAGLVMSLGVEPSRVSVGAWGVDTSFFAPGEPDQDVRAEVGWTPENRVVLTTRTWAPTYDVDTVLTGFAAAATTYSSLRLAWAGTGPDAPRLRKLVDTLGISHLVAELGRLPPADLRNWLRASDVYASAALSDGSSLSLLEALAVGTPVVVTDLPTNREWVPDATFGQVFPAGSSDGLAAALSDALRGPGGTVSRRARRAMVLERGDLATQRRAFLDVVGEVLG